MIKMLEWFKAKVKQELEAGQRILVSKALSSHFAVLEQGKFGVPGIAERLARFVVDGDDRAAVQDLSNRKSGGGGFIIGGPRGRFSQGLGGLLKVLPDDPELYVRLAAVYEAASQAGRVPMYSPLPGLNGGHSWLAAFLIELSGAGTKDSQYFAARLLQAMAAAKQEDASILVRGAMIVEDQQGKNKFSRWLQPPYTYFRCISGFPELVSQFPEVVREALHQSDAGARAYSLQALFSLEISPAPFLEDIAALAVSGSKEVREKAAPLIQASFTSFRPLLEASAVTGTSDERFHAVRLLARIGGNQAREFLTTRVQTEKSPKVADALRELLAEGSPVAQVAAAEIDDFGLPPIPDVSVKAPLDRLVLDDLEVCIDEFEKRCAEDFAKNKYAQAQKKTRIPVSGDTADKLFRALEDFVVEECKPWQFIEPFYWGGAQQILHKFGAHPQFELIHLVRWCLLISPRRKDVSPAEWRKWLFNYYWREPFLNYQKARKTPINLRELAAVFRAVGLDDRLIGRQWLRETKFAPAPFLRSDPDRIWPYFAERLDLLEEILGLTAAVQDQPAIYLRDKDNRQNAFETLKLFPRLPAKFVPLLWDIALGPSKTERPLAQECLAKTAHKEEKIMAALSSRQQDARLSAAEWLANLKYRQAVPALRTALAKEKSEPVKDELIRTLEILGVGLEELLHVDKLEGEAEKGLKKGIPDDLEWFPFAQLPSVRWSDSGKEVPQKIMQWLLVQACRLKNAEATPALRRYGSLFNQDDRERLGRFVLEIWIAKDTKPKYTAEQAAALAEKEATQAAAMAKQYPKYYPDFDQQKYYQAAYNRLLIQPEGSQTSTRGILALAGACCGSEAAPIVHRYIKQWYGYRPAQGKALLQVLAWTDEPAATQVVLSVANRFRTKGIQEEAMRLCQLLAERKGWTLDELSDRTIPTAGFDEDGGMELDYGARSFTVRLAEDMSIILSNQSGKTISSLPDANQSDDPEKVKQAKAALSAARKELKSVLAMQRERLYEALCTQRAWRFEDWDTYLHKHPIVGRYCQRLVWVIYEGDNNTTSFRPLADGTLTDRDDDEVMPESSASIRLAHEQTLAAADRDAWLEHFSDYKVEPLFQQFGKQTFTLSEPSKDETEINEFLGHVLKAFSLRNRLTRLGYTRGQAQDGGWFFDYRKSFLRLGIEAVIEFTGNGLPEQNRTVALQRLVFLRRNSDGAFSAREEVRLGDLPPVLLAECWNDIRMAAAEGSGFAADWDKQTEF